MKINLKTNFAVKLFIHPHFLSVLDCKLLAGRVHSFTHSTNAWTAPGASASLASEEKRWTRDTWSSPVEAS